MKPKDFFYCYNIEVSKFLKSKGIEYIHIAREPKSNKLYSLYFRDSLLETSINEYNKSK